MIPSPPFPLMMFSTTSACEFRFTETPLPLLSAICVARDPAPNHGTLHFHDYHYSELYLGRVRDARYKRIRSGHESFP